ncbi:MAG TPA: archaemetzincin [Thermoanaerobaculia bacterium]
MDQPEPLPKPGPNDWLANHPEAGQNFEEFVASRPNRPDKQRNAIYLQPLGDFTSVASPSLALLQQFASAFFMLPVKILGALDIEKEKITSRRNSASGQRQLLTGDILELLKHRVPTDAFCVIAASMIDLYPDPSWNFVFGQASLRERVGVYSFARYVADDPKLVLRRSCKVLAHETSHMFGVAHCIFYRCIMNGSNHLAESDARPMHLCPIDLRKLQWSVGFDVERRARLLQPIIDRVG